MSDDLKIVPIRGVLREDDTSSAPALNDIPAQLRQMADMIETGDYAGCDSLYLVMPQGGDFPIVFGWGDVKGRNEPLVQFELAKAWFISQAFGSDGWRT